MSAASRERLELLTRLGGALDATAGPADNPVAAPDGRSADGPRVAVLVLACSLPEYDHAVRSIRATWASEPGSDIDVWFVYGNPAPDNEYPFADLTPWTGVRPPVVPAGRVWQSGDVIVAGCSDVIWVERDCLLRKRLLGFAYLAAMQRYDFIVTVCATSYVDQQGLKDFVGGLPRAGVYQGPVGVCGETGRPYVSGSCIVMSIDVALALAGARRAIVEQNDGAYADDVALATWIAENLSGHEAQAIADRIIAGSPPTDDATFVFPVGVGIDLCSTPSDDIALVDDAWHYHLALQSVDDMEVVHRLHAQADGHRLLAATPHAQVQRPSS